MERDSVTPESVDISGEEILVRWQDGHVSRYPHRYLRLLCQCAECVDEFTKEPRLDPSSVPEHVRAVDYIPVGNYALQFLWSDAHFTGIYTYVFLRRVCRCPECAPGSDPQGAG